MKSLPTVTFVTLLAVMTGSQYSESNRLSEELAKSQAETARLILDLQSKDRIIDTKDKDVKYLSMMLLKRVNNRKCKYKMVSSH